MPVEARKSKKKAILAAALKRNMARRKAVASKETVEEPRVAAGEPGERAISPRSGAERSPVGDLAEQNKTRHGGTP